MLSTFDLLAVLLTLTAVFGWLNHRFVRLPHTIGLLLMGLLASLILIGIELTFPDTTLHADVTTIVRQIDFYEAVMNGMLAFLLFAGSLHVDLQVLKTRRLVVGLIATVGVVISTGIVGGGVWLLGQWIGLDIPLTWSLVFGALISPTDPVAVLSTLKEVKVSDALEAELTGESLFNDGVGVVIFSVLLAIAVGTAGTVEPLKIGRLLLVEAVGGALLGLLTGYIAYRAMRAIDNYPVEVLISLALVMGTYAVASNLHTSGPIAVVVAGLLIGTRGPQDAMSQQTQQYLFAFWIIVSEILNAVLFLLIGLEVLVLRFNSSLGWFAAVVIPLAFVARVVSVSGPVLLLRWFGESIGRGSIAILSWGGLRGGISVALALSLPEVPEKPVILAATYAVVLFTLVVQGLTFGRVVRSVLAVRQGSKARPLQDS